MAKTDYPEVVSRLILQLRQLPGIGPRSAERVALWMLQEGRESTAQIARVMDEALARIEACPVCGFFATEDNCVFCSDDRRSRRQLCLVEGPADVLPIERTGGYAGCYHVLGGRLSPLDNIGPDALRLPGLKDRITRDDVEEIILALGGDVEGEATGHFLRDYLAETGVRVTQLAQGLPAGSGLEHADTLTLLRALDGRR